MSMSPPREGPKDWGPSRTKQSAEPETNIKQIFSRFQATGEMTHISNALMAYRDMSDLPDLESAMNIVANANSLFAELPAHIRKRVGHDAANFLPFIDDPENLEECIELGILPKETKIVPKAHVSETKIVPTRPLDDVETEDPAAKPVVT